MNRAFFAMLGLMCGWLASVSQGQHADVLLLRQSDQLVTGMANFEEFVWSAGSRVFARDFDSDYEIENPGFNALSGTSPFMPAGYSALPGSTNVLWDFLPMTVPLVKSNLLYWNGLDSNGDGLDIDDVSFNTPTGYTLEIDGIGGVAAADGSDGIVSGPALVRTDSSGSIHNHRSFLLHSGVASDPVDGIYLIALRVKMDLLPPLDPLEPSAPFFLLFGTPGSTLASRNLAVSWVTQRVDDLVVDRIPGDYNDDGIVNAADYVVWRDTLGSMTKLVADGDGSESIDLGDYEVWQENFGNGTAPQSASMAIPEPNSIALAIILACVLAITPCGQWLRPRA